MATATSLTQARALSSPPLRKTPVRFSHHAHQLMLTAPCRDIRRPLPYLDLSRDPALFCLGAPVAGTAASISQFAPLSMVGLRRALAAKAGFPCKWCASISADVSLAHLSWQRTLFSSVRLSPLARSRVASLACTSLRRDCQAQSKGFGGRCDRYTCRIFHVPVPRTVSL